MKKIISTLILMFALVVSMAGANLVTASTSTSTETALLTSSAGAPSTKASVAGDRHPELVSGQIAFEQTEDDNPVDGNFFSRNWGILTLSLLGFFDVVARLTPTSKDNSIVNFLTTIINAIIPNFKKGGGVF